MNDRYWDGFFLAGTIFLVWNRLFAIVIISAVLAALPVLLVVNLLVKGLSSVTSTTYWSANEDLIQRVAFGVLLLVVIIVAVAVDYVKHPNEWK